MRMSNALHGFLLALTTALFRGTLPIALKQIPGRIEPLATVWLRFVVVSAPSRTHAATALKRAFPFALDKNS